MKEYNNEKKLFEKRWELMGKRFFETYPMGSDFWKKVGEKTEEMFEKISSHYGEEVDGGFNIDKDGKLVSQEAFPFMIGSIGEIINTLLENKRKEIVDEIKQNIGDLINEMWGTKLLKKCPHCGAWNPINDIICKDCKNDLTLE